MPGLVSLQGSYGPPVPSINKPFEKFTVYLLTKLFTLKKIVCLLLYVINAVTTELMIPLLMKPTVSFDVSSTGKMYVGKTQGISLELKFGHSNVAFPNVNGTEGR